MEWLKITTNNEIIRIPTDEIIFIKGDGNYSDIFLANGKKENVISQLHDLMDKLTTLNYNPFYRVGKSLIINRDYVFKVNPGLQRIILSNSRLEKDILIKASKDALKKLKEKLETETEEELTLAKELITEIRDFRESFSPIADWKRISSSRHPRMHLKN